MFDYTYIVMASLSFLSGYLLWPMYYFAVKSSPVVTFRLFRWIEPSSRRAELMVLLIGVILASAAVSALIAVPLVAKRFLQSSADPLFWFLMPILIGGFTYRLLPAFRS